MIIPEGKDEDHTLSKGSSHVGHTSLLLEGVSVTEGIFLGSAESSVDTVAGNARDGRLRVGDDLSILDVEALDIHAGAAADELGDDGELGAGVDGLALAVEGRVSHTVGVEIAPVGIARSGVASGGVGSSAGITIAHGLATHSTRVGSIGGGDRVGLPDVHLGAGLELV